MNQRAAWFTAVLLLMLAGLMISHLRLLHVGIGECDQLFKVQLEQVRRLSKQQKEQVTIMPQNSECNNLESDYQDVADRYVSVILALIGGGGVVAATANRLPRD